MEGRRADSFTSIVGRRSIYTSGTAPYNYIYLFRIANSASFSTLRVDIDIKTRYHRAVLFVDISSDQHPYGDKGTSIRISKLQLNSSGARLLYKMTKQSSGYNYIDFYYESGAWNSGSYDVILRGSNGTLVFEPKNTNIDNIPSGCTEVIKTPLDGDISGNAATATALKNSRTLWGQPFNGTANVSGNMTGVGSINMSGQLTSTVASGVAPFIVASNTVVGNLNADLLDGLHENSFLRHRDTYGIDGYNTLWSQIGIRQYNNAKPDGMANPIYNYGAVISLPGESSRLDIWYNHTSSASDSPTNGIQYRSGWGTDKNLGECC